MMKQILKATSVLLIPMIMSATTPIYAQSPDNTTTTRATTDDIDDDDDDDMGKWGLAGLLGLIGLAGLKRNDRDRRHTTTHVNTERRV